jgi:hypothetical protein
LEQEPKPLVFNDENEKFLRDTFYGSLNLLGKGIALLIKLVPTFIIYAILSAIYLAIYHARGFEEAIILIGVGVLIKIAARNN